MGFYRVVWGGRLFWWGLGIVEFLVVLVWVFVFVGFVSRYNLAKAKMTSTGHFENLSVAAQFLQ